MERARIGVGLIGILAGVAFPGIRPALATVYEVHATADDAALGPNGTCTLREAILAANADAPVDGCAAGSPGEDTILLDAATYSLTITGAAEDACATGDLDVTADLVIAGRGAAMTIVSAAGLGDRVLQVGAGATVRVQDLTIAGGTLLGAPSEAVAGGGVFNDGQLTLRRAAVSGNTALGGGVRDGGGATGGGVFSSATATLALDGSEVTGNQAKGGDGSGYCCTNEDPCHCFRVGNGGPASGGGIASAGALELERSVVTANAATGGNGAVFSGVDWGIPGEAGGGGLAVLGGTATVVDVALAENRASGGHGEVGATARGGAVYAAAGDTAVERAFVTENVTTGGDGFASLLSGANGGSALGAGVYVASGAAARLTNATLVNNAADGGDGQDGVFTVNRGGDAQGGGLYAGGATAVEHATFADNIVASGINEAVGAAEGADLHSTGATTVVNTILAASYAIVPPAAPVLSVCGGTSPATSLGGNVESPLATCAFATAGDLSSVSVVSLALEPLALNGGLTETRALGAGSVAIGTGSAVACAERDQRNFARGGAPCDAGAFEVGASSCTDADHDGAAVEGGVCGPGTATTRTPTPAPATSRSPATASTTTARPRRPAA